MADLTRKPEANLSNAKRALFAQWCRGQPPAPRNLSRRGGNGAPATLSFGQQQLWFFNQLQPESPLYNIPVAMELSGSLEVPALQNALDTLVVRHEILRSHFSGGDPEPVQLLGTPSAVSLGLVDLRNWPEADQRTKMRRLIDEEVRRPFDLGHDLMIRARLLQLSDREWALVLVMHHIASDIWSWRVLCRELAELYEAYLSKRTAVFAEPPLAYADFATMQLEAWQNGSFQGHIDYWRKKLSNFPPVLALAFDYPRPSVQSFQGACECLRISPNLSAALDDLSRGEGVTLFMVLLSVFQVLVQRYTRLEHILIGTPTAGRTRVEFEGVVGNFVNTLALPLNPARNISFLELLRRTRDVVLEALAHQELPFEKLVEAMRPERSANRLPLVQVMFALQDELALNLRLPSVSVTPLGVDTGTAKFDLTMTAVESADRLNFCAEYNSELFKKSTIRRMLGHFEQLCQEVVAQPDGPLSDLRLLTPPEQEALLIDWTNTKAEYPRNK